MRDCGPVLDEDQTVRDGRKRETEKDERKRETERFCQLLPSTRTPSCTDCLRGRECVCVRERERREREREKERESVQKEREIKREQ